MHHRFTQARQRASAALQRGFTLIELMVVLVIIGVLAALIVPNVMERADDARAMAAKNDVNNHFGKVGKIRQAFKYTDSDAILDDQDDEKDTTFAHIQTICARQFRRRKERRIHLTAMTPRAPRRAHRRSNTRAAQEYFPSSVPSDTDKDNDYDYDTASESDDNN